VSLDGDVDVTSLAATLTDRPASTAVTADIAVCGAVTTPAI